MAKFNYAHITDVAAKLIERFGFATTISRALDKNRTNTAQYACTVVVTDYNPKFVDGQLILATDRKVMVTAKNLAIIPNAETDQIVVQSETLRIVTVKKTSPGGLDIVYELQCRR